MSQLNFYGFAVRGPVAIGRLLLTLAAISLLTMPLTQHLWTWDRFLHGGQDFESGILTIVTVLCLAVLLSQICKNNKHVRLVVCGLLAGSGRDRESQARPSLHLFFILRPEQATAAAIGANSLPLKI